MTRNKMLVLMIVSSVLMFCSIFTMSYKILGIGLLQWVIVVFWSMNFAIGKRMTIADFSNGIDKQVDEAWNNKSYGKVATFVLVKPMMALGLLVVAVDIILMIFIL